MRMHMNGTIQFDAVFAVRAFGDVLVVPFTWWVIPLLSVENKKSDVMFKCSMMYALDLYALQRRHTCFWDEFLWRELSGQNVRASLGWFWFFFYAKQNLKKCELILKQLTF